MRKAVYTGISGIALLFLLVSCASFSLYSAYSRDVFEGKRLLEDEEYKEAEQHFLRAAEAVRGISALTYLAFIYYKTDRLDRAVALIAEADQLSPDNYLHLRAKGYKALILLKRDKKEGMAALKEYLGYYRHCDPLMTINDVARMLQSGDIDMDALEQLIEEQSSWYENDVEQFLKTVTGFYDRPFFPPRIFP